MREKSKMPCCAAGPGGVLGEIPLIDRVTVCTMVGSRPIRANRASQTKGVEFRYPSTSTAVSSSVTVYRGERTERRELMYMAEPIRSSRSKIRITYAELHRIV